MRIGQVSFVTPVIATDGAIAAVIAVLAGEELAALAAAALVVITLGIVLASAGRGARAGVERISPRALAFALGAAVLFAISFYGAGRTEGLDAIWVALVARIIGVAVITLPVLASGTLTLTRRALPFVLAAGCSRSAATRVRRGRAQASRPPSRVPVRGRRRRRRPARVQGV
jgi:hypothetical protein